MQELMLLVVFLLLMDWQAVFHLEVQSERAADSRIHNKALAERGDGAKRADAKARRILLSCMQTYVA